MNFSGRSTSRGSSTSGEAELAAVREPAGTWICERIGALFFIAYTFLYNLQWAINSAVHYNSWANLQAEEFRLVAEAFSDILDTMKCGNCESYVETHRHKGEDAEIRCDCGELFVNLRKKKAE